MKLSYKRTNTIEILGEVLGVVCRVKGTSRKRDGDGGVGGTGHRVRILCDRPSKEMVDSDVSKCCSLRSTGLARQVGRPALHSQSGCPSLITDYGCRKGGTLSLKPLNDS